MGKKELTDKEKLFRDQLGQKATVQRFDLSDEKTAIVNRLLCDLGLEMQKVDGQLQHFTYMGSAAVHVFAAPTVDLQVYIPQVKPLHVYRCPQQLANAALLDLERQLKASYGLRTSKLRSGF